MNILLIEDEPPAARRLQKLLDRVLVNLGDWGAVAAEVTWIGEPDAALAEAAKGPDLIFLDLNLAGFHTLDWIREARIPPEQTIIVSADTRYCDEALAMGVFAYLFKPVEEAQLRSHLERFLKGRNRIA
jgi:response regulator of citrate/malate metabolism